VGTRGTPDDDARMRVVAVEEPVTINVQALDAAPQLLVIAVGAGRVHGVVPHGACRAERQIAPP
jgi:hypothetical protein